MSDQTLAQPEAARAQDAPARFYQPELDALRFLAFLLVYLHHLLPQALPALRLWDRGPLAAIANAGAFGLPLFFFISAYLITTLLLIERSRGPIDVAGFYIRRVLRIWPLYYLGLAIGLIFALAFGFKGQIAMLGQFALFIGNFFFQTHPWSINPMTPLWSISVEEQFYLIAPALIALAGSRYIAIAGGALAALSLAWLYGQGQAHAEIGRVIWTHTFSQALFFGLGMIAAGATQRRRIDLPAPARLACAGAAPILFFCAAYAFDGYRYGAASSGMAVVLGYLAAAGGCLCALGALLNPSFAIPAPLTYLGKISYGLYVFHQLSLWAAGRSHAALVLALIPTIALAALSYRFFEKPFLKLRARFTRVANRPL
jgi:peptidoglycan/LPS O-acetylase OafA/YrhL